jgi:hypothetical protein
MPFYPPKGMSSIFINRIPVIRVFIFTPEIQMKFKFFSGGVRPFAWALFLLVRHALSDSRPKRWGVLHMADAIHGPPEKQ